MNCKILEGYLKDEYGKFSICNFLDIVVSTACYNSFKGNNRGNWKLFSSFEQMSNYLIMQYVLTHAGIMKKVMKNSSYLFLWC